LTDVLILCTANICRSPMAEGLLRHRLDRLGVPARVHSAGRLYEGEPVSTGSVDALRARGLDITAHRSRRTTAALLQGADLVLAMERAHVREAVALEPSVWPRTFTLKELVRRGEAVGPRRHRESLAEWLDRVGRGRGRAELLGSDPVDDVADPIGGPPGLYARTAEEIDGLLDRLVVLAFAPGPRSSPDPHVEGASHDRA
jgi:protein-tyrosine phosphatase